MRSEQTSSYHEIEKIEVQKISLKINEHMDGDETNDFVPNPRENLDLSHESRHDFTVSKSRVVEIRNSNSTKASQSCKSR